MAHEPVTGHRPSEGDDRPNEKTFTDEDDEPAQTGDGLQRFDVGSSSVSGPDPSENAMAVQWWNDPDLVKDSCIEVSEIVLVSLVTLRLWRAAYDRGSFEEIDQIVNPP